MADIPDPNRNPLPISADRHSVSAHDLLVADLQGWEAQHLTATTEATVAERKRYGLIKYEVILHKDNGRDYPLDAIDEALDQAVYLRMMIVRGDAPQAWLEPFYRDAVWALVALDLFRTTGELLPQTMKYSFPLAELDVIGQQNIDPAQDDEHACRVPPGEIFETEWIFCGALQFDHQMCTRSLTDPVEDDAYGWCVRHGSRLEPNEKADERSRCVRCELPIERHGEAWRHSFDLPEGGEPGRNCPRAVPPGETEAWLDQLDPDDPSVVVERNPKPLVGEAPVAEERPQGIERPDA